MKVKKEHSITHLSLYPEKIIVNILQHFLTDLFLCEYSWPLKSVGVWGSDFPHIHVLTTASPLYGWFLHIHRFNQLWIKKKFLEKKKNLPIRAPMQFKPKLFKGQLYILFQLESYLYGFIAFFFSLPVSFKSVPMTLKILWEPNFFFFVFLFLYFFHYSWFPLFCQFSTAQWGDSVTHTCLCSFFSYCHAFEFYTVGHWYCWIFFFYF